MMYKLELQSIGLSKKEAAVYSTLLTLGPASVQSIARKSGIARGTTYIVIKDLIQRGLVSVKKDHKRRLFFAEHPERLIGMLEKQRTHIESNIMTAERLLPVLHATMRTQQEKPIVRYYEGKEGLQLMRQEMVMHSKSGDTWLNFAPVDALERTFGFNDMVCTTRIRKGITSRTIAFTSSEKMRRTLLEKSRKERSERKFFFDSQYTFDSGLTIFCDRIALGCFQGNLGGIIIESPSLAALLRQCFELTWRSL